MITFQPSMCHTTFYMLLKTKQNKTKKKKREERKKGWVVEGTRDFARWTSSESSAGRGEVGNRFRKSSTEKPRSEAVRKTAGRSSMRKGKKRKRNTGVKEKIKGKVSFVHPSSRHERKVRGLCTPRFVVSIFRGTRSRPSSLRRVGKKVTGHT